MHLRRPYALRCINATAPSARKPTGAFDLPAPDVCCIHLSLRGRYPANGVRSSAVAIFLFPNFVGTTSLTINFRAGQLRVLGSLMLLISEHLDEPCGSSDLPAGMRSSAQAIFLLMNFFLTLPYSKVTSLRSEQACPEFLDFLKLFPKGRPAELRLKKFQQCRKF